MSAEEVSITFNKGSDFDETLSSMIAKFLGEKKTSTISLRLNFYDPFPQNFLVDSKLRKWQVERLQLSFFPMKPIGLHLDSFKYILGLKDLHIIQCDTLQCGSECLGQLFTTATALERLTMNKARASDSYCLQRLPSKLRELRLHSLIFKSWDVKNFKLAHLESLTVSGSNMPCETGTEVCFPALRHISICKSEAPFSLSSLFRYSPLLETMHLSHLDVKQCPAEISILINLREMMMSHCKLVGSLPSEIGSLTQLRLLDLSGNKQLNFIPEDISALSYLEYINVSNTDIRQLPNGIGCLMRLERLDAHSCQLSEIPLSLVACQNLKTANFNGDPLPIMLRGHWDGEKLRDLLSAFRDDSQPEQPRHEFLRIPYSELREVPSPTAPPTQPTSHPAAPLRANDRRALTLRNARRPRAISAGTI